MGSLNIPAKLAARKVGMIPFIDDWLFILNIYCFSLPIIPSLHINSSPVPKGLIKKKKGVIGNLKKANELKNIINNIILRHCFPGLLRFLWPLGEGGETFGSGVGMIYICRKPQSEFGNYEVLGIQEAPITNSSFSVLVLFYNTWYGICTPPFPLPSSHSTTIPHPLRYIVLQCGNILHE